MQKFMLYKIVFLFGFFVYAQISAHASESADNVKSIKSQEITAALILQTQSSQRCQPLLISDTVVGIEKTQPTDQLLPGKIAQNDDDDDSASQQIIDGLKGVNRSMQCASNCNLRQSACFNRCRGSYQNRSANGVACIQDCQADYSECSSNCQ